MELFLTSRYYVYVKTNKNNNSSGASRLETLNNNINRLKSEIADIENVSKNQDSALRAKMEILPSFFGVDTISDVMKLMLNINKTRKDSKRLSTEEKQLAVSLLKNHEPVATIAKILGVSRPTIYSLRHGIAA